MRKFLPPPLPVHTGENDEVTDLSSPEGKVCRLTSAEAWGGAGTGAVLKSHGARQVGLVRP